MTPIIAAKTGHQDLQVPSPEFYVPDLLPLLIGVSLVVFLFILWKKSGGE